MLSSWLCLYSRLCLIHSASPRPLHISTCILGFRMLEVEGIAQLCFTEDGSLFHGNMVTPDRRQYGLVGTTSDLPKDQFHQCCFDEVPQFYTIRVIDHSSPEVTNGEDDDIVLRYVMRTGGDNCSLTSDDVTFYTEHLIVDEKAKDLIKEHFSAKFKDLNCYICVGPISIKCSL